MFFIKVIIPSASPIPPPMVISANNFWKNINYGRWTRLPSSHPLRDVPVFERWLSHVLLQARLRWPEWPGHHAAVPRAAKRRPVRNNRRSAGIVLPPNRPGNRRPRRPVSVGRRLPRRTWAVDRRLRTATTSRPRSVATTRGTRPAAGTSRPSSDRSCRPTRSANRWPTSSTDMRWCRRVRERTRNPTRRSSRAYRRPCKGHSAVSPLRRRYDSSDSSGHGFRADPGKRGT